MEASTDDGAESFSPRVLRFTVPNTEQVVLPFGRQKTTRELFLLIWAVNLQSYIDHWFAGHSRCFISEGGHSFYIFEIYATS